MTTQKLIQKYPKIFQDYEGNPGMVNWHGVPEGWLPIIDKLCGSIQNYIDNYKRWIKEKDEWVHPPQLTCTQMKEKYGGLRFYYEGGDDLMEGMVVMAEYLCSNTCQDCGSEQDIGRTAGWITTLCRSCAIAHGDRAISTWSPLKSNPDV